MIELQDEIEVECVNNTELWVRSNQRTPPNQTIRLRPHFRSPSPSLSATRSLQTPERSGALLLPLFFFFLFLFY